jgi:hypothetical protein
VTQLTLDLGMRPAYGLEDFIVAAPNRAAVAWIDSWPGWPGVALAVTGPPGSGKTHLCQVWRQRAGARPIDLAALAAAPPPELVGDAPAISRPRSCSTGSTGRCPSGRCSISSITSPSSAASS